MRTSSLCSIPALALLLLSSAAAYAAPAITCHCFTDRSYDPSEPAKADPYFLATTQNSFLAAAFNTDKRGIVVKKQKGLPSDDLWIAHWIAANSGRTADGMLDMKERHETWPRAIAALGIGDKTLGTRLSQTLKTSPTSPRLAGAVVDELLVRYRLLGEKELSSLRRQGAVNQELILAALIAPLVRQSAETTFGQVRGGKASWGYLLDKAGIKPGEIHGRFVALLQPGRNSSAY